MNKFLKFYIALLAIASGMAGAQNTPQTQLERTILRAGIHQIDTQLATTAEQRMTGLMYRNEAKLKD